jgi:hypothetical protein
VRAKALSTAKFQTSTVVSAAVVVAVVVFLRTQDEKRKINI